MGLSSSTKKTKESGFRTESGTTTPVLPQPLQTGLTGLIDKTNQLAGEDPYGLVAGASGLQGQAFQAASTDLGGWQAPMKHAGQMVGEATGAAPAYANAFTYQAPQIGSAELGSVSAAQLPGLGGPTQMTAQSYQAPQLGGPASYQAQTAQTPQIGNVASYDVTGYAPQLASAQQAGFQSYNPVLSGAAAQAQSQQGQAALGAAAFGEASLGQASAAQASLASAQQAAASFGQAALMSAPRLAAAAQASGHGYDAAQAGRTELGAVSGYNPAQMQAAEAGRTLVDPIERVQAASLLDNLQAYQNPYERQVVDATLAGYDAQAGQAAAAMKAQAAKAGAFGGSRFGIAQGQFEADNSRNRALTQAQLLSQGFDRATALSQSDAANRQQAGLANQSAANSRSALQAQLDSTTDLANAGFRQQTNQANANWQNDASRFLADAGLQRILAQGNLDSQRELANAGFANSARQFNSDLGARLSMFNTEATNTRNLQQGQHDFGAAQTNANNLTQTSNSNAQLGTQASLTNAELGTRAAMANADRLTQTSNSNADRFTSMSNSNADRLTSTSNANADRLTQTSNSNARNLTDTSNANAELGTRTSIANMQSSNENSWRNMEASNRAAEFGASAFNANQNQNAQLGTQTNIQNAQFGNDAQSRFADSLNQRGRDEAGAINSRNTSQAQLDAQMGTFNIGQINQQLRDAGQWTNDFAKSNADYQAQALRDNVSAANRASELNSAAANQFALNRFEQQSAAARQFAGDSNQANLTRYTTDSQRAADQARLAAQASEFGANALNAQAQFNANQYDDGLQRQLQGAGIYGDLANNFAANMRGDIGLQAQLGEQQRQIQQQQLMARYAQLQALGELYKYGQPMVGQATTGNSNFSSNSVSKEKPSAFDMLMQVGERIGQAAAAGSDRRLKRDVERIGTLDSGLGLYRFNYHWDAKGRAPRTGVMADEVARLVPQALGPVVAGYGTVNYEALGLAHLVEG